MDAKSVTGITLSLLLAALAIVFKDSIIYAVLLMSFAGLLATVFGVKLVKEYLPKIFSDKERPKLIAQSIYRAAAQHGGIIHATHVFPISSDFTQDLAVTELKGTPTVVGLSFHRILLMDSDYDEKHWVNYVFASIPKTVSITIYVLKTRPLYIPRFLKTVLPRLNLLLYKSHSGSTRSFVGLDRLPQPNIADVNFAMESRNRRIYSTLLKYFERITGSGYFDAYSVAEAYAKSRNLRSPVIRGQSTAARIVNFAETTPGISLVGLFGSMAQSSLGIDNESVVDPSDLDVDILLIYDPDQLDCEWGEIRDRVESYLNRSVTAVTWGPDLTPFYEFRDDLKINVEIECFPIGSSFFVQNRLLGYSVFRSFLPMYSAEGRAVVPLLSIPSDPLSAESRWSLVLRDRQGIEQFANRMKSEQVATDPRRLCVHLIRNAVWASTGIWPRSARDAYDYLVQSNVSVISVGTLKASMTLLNEEPEMIKADLMSRMRVVEQLISELRSFALTLLSPN